MFSRKSCYFFVRPKRHFLELCIFLGRTLKAPKSDEVTPHRSPRYITSFTELENAKKRFCIPEPSQLLHVP
jgi:hypothetical protein